jgi:hypothetical protein
VDSNCLINEILAFFPEVDTKITVGVRGSMYGGTSIVDTI